MMFNKKLADEILNLNNEIEYLVKVLAGLEKKKSKIKMTIYYKKQKFNILAEEATKEMFNDRRT